MTHGVQALLGPGHETASYLPTPRSRRNERLRLTLPDPAPVAPRLAEKVAPANRCLWNSLENRTEAAYVRQALSGDWPAAPDPAPGELALVCRPNLDVYSGLASLYRTGTATCAPTAPPPCSGALSIPAASPMMRCGSDPALFRHRTNLPPVTATLLGWESTRDQDSSARRLPQARGAASAVTG